MKPAPSFTWSAVLGLFLVLTCAAGARVWYVTDCADSGRRDALLQVQGDYPRPPFPEGTIYRRHTDPTELDNLVANIADHEGLKCLAPLAQKEELTAHLAPGYPWLFAMVAANSEDADQAIRWLQCALGSLTVAFYFLFARRAFHNTFVATLAGLLMAFYPFWIVNTTELNDGVVTCFLLSACLMFGTRASHTGGALTSLLFGLSLAGLVLARAAMLPFALAAILWLLWRCRRFSLGWYAGLVTLAGFANVTLLFLRNSQVYDQPVALSTSTYYHLWMGNNPSATGGVLDESALRASLPEARLETCMSEPNQAKRYDMLASDVMNEVIDHPAQTLTRRFKSALAFFLGEYWFKQGTFSVRKEGAVEMPEEVQKNADTIFSATVLGMFGLAILGWRWSYAWRTYGRLGAIAAVWIPIPYILSHAEALSGPRLPLDGVLLCYASYALASFIPGAVRDREPFTKPAKAP